VDYGRWTIDLKVAHGNREIRRHRSLGNCEGSSEFNVQCSTFKARAMTIEHFEDFETKTVKSRQSGVKGQES